MAHKLYKAVWVRNANLSKLVSNISAWIEIHQFNDHQTMWNSENSYLHKRQQSFKSTCTYKYIDEINTAHKVIINIWKKLCSTTACFQQCTER